MIRVLHQLLTLHVLVLDVKLRQLLSLDLPDLRDEYVDQILVDVVVQLPDLAVDVIAVCEHFVLLVVLVVVLFHFVVHPALVIDFLVLAVSARGRVRTVMVVGELVVVSLLWVFAVHAVVAHILNCVIVGARLLTRLAAAIRVC